MITHEQTWLVWLPALDRMRWFSYRWQWTAATGQQVKSRWHTVPLSGKHQRFFFLRCNPEVASCVLADWSCKCSSWWQIRAADWGCEEEPADGDRRSVVIQGGGVVAASCGVTGDRWVITTKHRDNRAVLRAAFSCQFWFAVTVDLSVWLF